MLDSYQFRTLWTQYHHHSPEDPFSLSEAIKIIVTYTLEESRDVVDRPDGSRGKALHPALLDLLDSAIPALQELIRTACRQRWVSKEFIIDPYDMNMDALRRGYSFTSMAAIWAGFVRRILITEERFKQLCFPVNTLTTPCFPTTSQAKAQNGSGPSPKTTSSTCDITSQCLPSLSSLSSSYPPRTVKASVKHNEILETSDGKVEEKEQLKYEAERTGRNSSKGFSSAAESSNVRSTSLTEDVLLTDTATSIQASPSTPFDASPDVARAVESPSELAPVTIAGPWASADCSARKESPPMPPLVTTCKDVVPAYPTHPGVSPEPAHTEDAYASSNIWLMPGKDPPIQPSPSALLDTASNFAGSPVLDPTTITRPLASAGFSAQKESPSMPSILVAASQDASPSLSAFPTHPGHPPVPTEASTTRHALPRSPGAPDSATDVTGAAKSTLELSTATSAGPLASVALFAGKNAPSVPLTLVTTFQDSIPSQLLCPMHSGCSPALAQGEDAPARSNIQLMPGKDPPMPPSPSAPLDTALGTAGAVKSPPTFNSLLAFPSTPIIRSFVDSNTSSEGEFDIVPQLATTNGDGQDISLHGVVCVPSSMRSLSRHDTSPISALPHLPIRLDSTRNMPNAVKTSLALPLMLVTPNTLGQTDFVATPPFCSSLGLPNVWITRSFVVFDTPSQLKFTSTPPPAVATLHVQCTIPGSLADPIHVAFSSALGASFEMLQADDSSASDNVSLSLPTTSLGTRSAITPPESISHSHRIIGLAPNPVPRKHSTTCLIQDVTPSAAHHTIEERDFRLTDGYWKGQNGMAENTITSRRSGSFVEDQEHGDPLSDNLSPALTVSPRGLTFPTTTRAFAVSNPRSRTEFDPMPPLAIAGCNTAAVHVHGAVAGSLLPLLPPMLPIRARDPPDRDKSATSTPRHSSFVTSTIARSLAVSRTESNLDSFPARTTAASITVANAALPWCSWGADVKHHTHGLPERFARPRPETVTFSSSSSPQPPSATHIERPPCQLTLSPASPTLAPPSAPIVRSFIILCTLGQAKFSAAPASAFPCCDGAKMDLCGMDITCAVTSPASFVSSQQLPSKPIARSFVDSRCAAPADSSTTQDIATHHYDSTVITAVRRETTIKQAQEHSLPPPPIRDHWSAPPSTSPMAPSPPALREEHGDTLLDILSLVPTFLLRSLVTECVPSPIFRSCALLSPLRRLDQCPIATTTVDEDDGAMMGIVRRDPVESTFVSLLEQAPSTTLPSTAASTPPPPTRRAGHEDTLSDTTLSDNLSLPPTFSPPISSPLAHDTPSTSGSLVLSNPSTPLTQDVPPVEIMPHAQLLSTEVPDSTGDSPGAVKSSLLLSSLGLPSSLILQSRVVFNASTKVEVERSHPVPPHSSTLLDDSTGIPNAVELQSVPPSTNGLVQDATPSATHHTIHENDFELTDGSWERQDGTTGNTVTPRKSGPVVENEEHPDNISPVPMLSPPGLPFPAITCLFVKSGLSKHLYLHTERDIVVSRDDGPTNRAPEYTVQDTAAPMALLWSSWEANGKLDAHGIPERLARSRPDGAASSTTPQQPPSPLVTPRRPETANANPSTTSRFVSMPPGIPSHPLSHSDTLRSMADKVKTSPETARKPTPASATNQIEAQHGLTSSLKTTTSRCDITSQPLSLLSPSSTNGFPQAVKVSPNHSKALRTSDVNVKGKETLHHRVEGTKRSEFDGIGSVAEGDFVHSTFSVPTSLLRKTASPNQTSCSTRLDAMPNGTGALKSPPPGLSSTPVAPLFVVTNISIQGELGAPPSYDCAEFRLPGQIHMPSSTHSLVQHGTPLTSESSVDSNPPSFSADSFLWTKTGPHIPLCPSTPINSIQDVTGTVESLSVLVSPTRVTPTVFAVSLVSAGIVAREESPSILPTVVAACQDVVFSLFACQMHHGHFPAPAKASVTWYPLPPPSEAPNLVQDVRRASQSPPGVLFTLINQSFMASNASSPADFAPTPSITVAGCDAAETHVRSIVPQSVASTGSSVEGGLSPEPGLDTAMLQSRDVFTYKSIPSTQAETPLMPPMLVAVCRPALLNKVRDSPDQNKSTKVTFLHGISLSTTFVRSFAAPWTLTSVSKSTGATLRMTFGSWITLKWNCGARALGTWVAC